jgi:hypothetical protein
MLKGKCILVGSCLSTGSDTAIVYCSSGFGPRSPWGLLFLTRYPNMGMDSQWFVSLEDAVRESMAWEGQNPPGYEVG